MKVRLGIIGTGIAARELHLPALQNIRDKFEITCVCNHTEKKAKDFSALVAGVPYVLDYHELLARKDVDAVDIVLPIHLNCRVTEDALESGKHVIVEKPIASNLKDADRMVGFTRKYSLAMMVAENYRYNPVFKKVREVIESGTIGEAYSVFWDHFTVTDSSNKFAQTAWRINHQYPGGFVMDAGIHNIAVLRDLFGEFKSGIAHTRNINPAIGKMDSMSFEFIFENGVSGVFNTFFSAKGLNVNTLKILGTNGSVVAEGNKVSVLRENFGEVSESNPADRGYQGQFEDFYEAIINHKVPVSTFDKAYKDFKVMVSAFDSADKWSTSQLSL